MLDSEGCGGGEMIDTNEILTAEEAAQLLRVCPSQIRTLARKGLIPCGALCGACY